MVLDAVARGLGFTVVSRLVLETSPGSARSRSYPCRNRCMRPCIW